MKYLKYMVLLFLPCLMGATYYVTKDGNDGSAGTSWATAWGTTSKVNSTISAGDTVLFGTGVWRNSRIEPETGGHGELPTIYACSTWAEMPTTWAGEGKNLSKIYAGDSITSWTFWKMIGADSAWWAVWTPTLVGGGGGGKCLCLAQDDSAMVLCVGTSLAEISNIDGPGEFIYTYNEGDTMFACLYGGQNPNYNEMLASTTSVVEFTSQNNCHLKGLHLFHSSAGTIRFTGAADSNRFEYCALRYGSGFYNDNCAVIYSTHYTDSGDSTDHGWHNTFYACSLGVASEPGDGWGNSGAIIYSQHYMYFDSCYFEQFGEYGIFWKHPSDASSTGYRSYNVTRNCVFNGMGYHGVYYYNNNVACSTYANIIINPGSCGIRIYKGSGNETGFSNNVFLNNTIYDPGDYFFVDLNHETGSNNIVKYNIGYYVADGEAIALNNGSAGTFSVIDSNYYYCIGSAFQGMCETDTWTNFAGWNTCGFDEQGSATTDPAFSDSTQTSWTGAWSGFARPNAGTEMAISYGGRNWRQFGAVQNMTKQLEINVSTNITIGMNDEKTDSICGVPLIWNYRDYRLYPKR